MAARMPSDFMLFSEYRVAGGRGAFAPRYDAMTMDILGLVPAEEDEPSPGQLVETVASAEAPSFDEDVSALSFATPACKRPAYASCLNARSRR